MLEDHVVHVSGEAVDLKTVFKDVHVGLDLSDVSVLLLNEFFRFVCISFNLAKNKVGGCFQLIGNLLNLL